SAVRWTIAGEQDAVDIEIENRDRAYSVGTEVVHASKLPTAARTRELECHLIDDASERLAVARNQRPRDWHERMFPEIQFRARSRHRLTSGQRWNVECAMKIERCRLHVVANRREAGEIHFEQAAVAQHSRGFGQPVGVVEDDE